MAFPKTRQAIERQITFIPPTKILPNPHQIRTQFDKAALTELAHSIRTHGVLQPLHVRKRNDGQYELISGERRLRASLLCGLDVLPCFILEATRQDSCVLSLIENNQRKKLDFLEETKALAHLMKSYALSQKEVANKVGKSQSAIANKLRLLHLPSEVLTLLQRNNMSERHARCLLRLPTEELQLEFAKMIVSNKMTVSKSEELISNLLDKETKEQHPPAKSLPTPNKQRKTYIIRDVRFFLNSVNHGISIMKTAGIDAEYEKNEDGNHIFLTIRIPKEQKSS